MKYLFIVLQIVELILVAGMVSGNEYIEDIFIPFVLFVILFLVFVMLARYYKKQVKIVVVSSSILMVLLATWLGVVIFRGYGYFLNNWKNFQAYEFRNLIIFLSIIILFQATKIFVIKRMSKSNAVK